MRRSSSTTASLLDRIALGLIGLFALQGAMNFVQVYVLTSTTERIIARLREQLFARLIRLSPAFFTDQRTGELTSRLSADLAVLQTLCNTYVSEFARQSILLVGGVVMLTLTNPRLAADHARRRHPSSSRPPSSSGGRCAAPAPACRTGSPKRWGRRMKPSHRSGRFRASCAKRRRLAATPRICETS